MAFEESSKYQFHFFPRSFMFPTNMDFEFNASKKSSSKFYFTNTQKTLNIFLLIYTTRISSRNKHTAVVLRNNPVFNSQKITKLKIQQSIISKINKNDDLHASTLRAMKRRPPEFNSYLLTLAHKTTGTDGHTSDAHTRGH